MILAPLSKVSDSRRTIINLFRDNIKDINYYEAKKGAVLGNHYHKDTKEYFFFTKGTALIKTETSSEVVSRGALFVIEPMNNHSVECLSDVNFLTFLTKEYNEKEPDLWKK